MSKCELSLKSIADSQIFSNNSFTYFWDSFHMLKFFMSADLSVSWHYVVTLRRGLFFLKDTLSIEYEKLFKACKSVCSSVC